MLYIGLYSEDGGTPKAYYCCTCKDVTRTAVGMRHHLYRKHNIKLQLEMFPAQDEELIRENTVDHSS